MPEPQPPDAPPAGDGSEQEGHPSAGVNLLRGYQFRLIVDPNSDGHFISCTGPVVRVPPIQYREGGEGKIVRLFPGYPEHGEVVCRFGLTTSPLLWNWFQKTMEGKPERRNVSLVMLGASGVGERIRWNLNEAWPCEWRAAPVHALSRKIAIATVCLCYESLTLGGAP